MRWDPPMHHDPPAYMVEPKAPPADKESDLKDPVWRTSIVAPRDMTQPSAVALLFESGDGSDCKLYIPPTSFPLIELVNPPTSLSRFNNLQIVAKDTSAPSEIQAAEIWVIPKTSALPPNAASVLVKLWVSILPERLLPISIWRIYDSSPGSGSLPAGIPSNNAILARIKEIFEQTGIKPYLDGGSDTPIDVAYDSDAPKGQLNASAQVDSDWSDEERNIASRPAFAGKKVRIFIVNEGTAPGATAYAKANKRATFIYASPYGSDTEALKTTCAHEVAHILGLTSRNKTVGFKDSHEHGAFPEGTFDRGAGIHLQLSVSALMETGMGGGRRWLRHEDWRIGNNEARTIIARPPVQ